VVSLFTIDKLLARLHANEAELLMVLDRPEIPLHTRSYGRLDSDRCSWQSELAKPLALEATMPLKLMVWTALTVGI
jgi:hypothetical protein